MLLVQEPRKVYSDSGDVQRLCSQRFASAASSEEMERERGRDGRCRETAHDSAGSRSREETSCQEGREGEDSCEGAATRTERCGRSQMGLALQVPYDKQPLIAASWARQAVRAYSS